MMPSNQSPWVRQMTRLMRDPKAVIGIFLLGALTLAVIFLPALLPRSEAQNLNYVLKAPTLGHLFGTDHLGRDILSRVMTGGRLSLAIGLLATVVSMVVGTLYGCISAYAGGRMDRVMMRIVDVLYSLPYMFLVILFIFIFGKNLAVLFLALGLVQWLTVARVVRGQVLSLKHEEYVLAAKILGVGPLRIILRHILPNVMGIVIVYATLTVPSVILQEAFLSFLGLNVESCTWGVLIAEGKDYMEVAYWVIAFPGLVLTLTLLALNLLGDSFRDIFDPRNALDNP